MDDELFTTESELSVIAPQATEAQIKELFETEGTDDDGSSVRSVQSVAQRSILYFGECFYCIL